MLRHKRHALDAIYFFCVLLVGQFTPYNSHHCFTLGRIENILLVVVENILF